MDEHELIGSILAASDGPHDWDALQAATRHIEQTFLTMGSETDENLNCVRQIEMGLYREPILGHPRTVGLRLTGSHIPLSDIAHTLESSPIPATVREDFPDLTDSQWNAVTRLVTMILISLERHIPKGRLE